MDWEPHQVVTAEISLLSSRLKDIFYLVGFAGFPPLQGKGIG